ncbi:hypothetical protein NQ317_008893 [Molorchus minor]|uniref:Uncharacterized protein n=1 Tax=Molorchus minor TaxID=1323400 RepID=A0ABQ9JLS6_9CUCU|nr:hypothetical protein NQ317_008893 [Molorchus minor]
MLVMGMWYGAGLIDHQQERHFSTPSTTCPIVHISEYRAPITENPLYRNYNYSYGYGTGRGYGTPVPQRSALIQYEKCDAGYGQIINRDRLEYDRRTTYPNAKEGLHYSSYVPTEMKYLKDYIGTRVTAQVLSFTYGTTLAGLVFGSVRDQKSNKHQCRVDRAYHARDRQAVSQQSGACEFEFDYRYLVACRNVLEPEIQPLRWYNSGSESSGNTLGANFCHQIPERQLYTVILSREVKLEPVEIHGVHGLLHRKGLSTNAVKKVCNNKGNRISHIELYLLLIPALIKFVI